MKFFTILFMVMVSYSGAFAQNLIKGTVKDVTGEELVGVTIIVIGTDKNAITDAQGVFSIEAKPGSILQFNYVGYETLTITVPETPLPVIIMKQQDQELHQVVVIGYQTVKKKDLTGSMGIVDINSEKRITSNSIVEAIQGLMPGVTVRNGGAPGQNPIVEIRGIGSFGNSNPLYVIDGMLADANVTINPDDVETIQVLKDASAAAIYGSRAGNGVIIITTKKGKEGAAKVTFSAKYGSQQIPQKWNVMDATGYLKTVQQEYANSGVDLPSGIAAQLSNNTINTNWQKEMFPNGNDQDYNLSISGGSNNSNYMISGSYFKNKGDVVGNDFERYSLRINSEAKKGKFTLGENIVISNTNGENPGGGVNAFYEAAQMLPIIAVQGDQYKSIQYNPAGWGMGTTNIPTYASNYLAANALDHQTYNNAKIVGNIHADINFTKWLYYRFNVGTEASFYYYKAVRDTGIWRYTNQPPLTNVSEDRERSTNLLLEHTLNFNQTFGLHSINGVIGFSRTEQRRDFTEAGKTELQTANGELFTTIGSALGASTASSGTPVHWKSHGYLARINYAYDDKYLVTLTGRIDQDSRFGPNYRTGFFPSVATAWRISREKFFKVKWVYDLKLRASYGRLGFSDVLGSWDYIGFLDNYPRAIYGVSQSPLVGQYQAQIANPDLHWETRIQKNAGFDASLLNHRVSLSVDVYNSTSKDVLVNLPVSMVLGSTGSTNVNAGSIQNTGVEFSVTYRNKITDPKQFRWDVTGNFTTIKNKVLSVGNQGSGTNYLEASNNFIRSQVGHSIGEWYLIQSDGIFKTQAEIDSYVDKNGVKIQANATPGDVKYVDANGDGIINNGDRVFSGSPWPTMQTGAQFNAYYKNFTLNIQLVGVFGDKLYNDVRRAMDSYQLTNFRKNIDPWSTTNPNGTDPRLVVDQPSDPTVSINNMAQTTRWLESGSYVRVRNIEIGYDISKSLLDYIKFSSARVFISAQNLFTLTKYSGLDPDVQGNGILQRGFDVGNWPSSRVFSAGIVCEF